MQHESCFQIDYYKHRGDGAVSALRGERSDWTLETRMRALWVALGAAGLLIAPQAFADFSFSFSSRTQQEHAGSSSGWGGGASAEDALSQDASPGGPGGRGAAGRRS